MNVRKPISHWNNFTVPELEEIIEHCRALERLGIAQDEEMMCSMERDIKMRPKVNTNSIETKIAKVKQMGKQKATKMNKKGRVQEFLLEQNA